MIALLAVLISGPLAPPPPDLVGPIQGAIWHDLELNAMIGNGAWNASLWYNASSGGAPDLHILDLRCRGRGGGYDCAFTLMRDGGPGMAFDEVAPDKLDCTARLVTRRDGGEVQWRVFHTPPRGAGHSRTSMDCKPA